MVDEALDDLLEVEEDELDFFFRNDMSSVTVLEYFK